MGIRHLNRFLRKYAPAIHHSKSLDEYRGQTWAIDTYIYLYAYKIRHRSRWLSTFLKMILQLLDAGIQPVFVYDTHAPPEKRDCQEQRRTDRRKTVDQITLIESALGRYNDGNATPDDLQLLRTTLEQQDDGQMKKLLTYETDIQNLINTTMIDIYLAKLHRQTVSVRGRDVTRSKQLLDVLGIPHIDSENEAETLCAFMSIHGLVDAVLSDDTDVLVYGTPRFISRLDINRGRCLEMCYDEVIAEVGLTSSSFLDFCILCGTDYNQNMYRVGYETAYKLIRQFGSIDAIESGTQHNTSILNHERVREIFAVPSIPPTVEFQRGQFDILGFDELKKIANLGYDKQLMDRCFGSGTTTTTTTTTTGSNNNNNSNSLVVGSNVVVSSSSMNDSEVLCENSESELSQVGWTTK